MELSEAQRQYASSWVCRFVAPELDTAAIPDDLLMLVFRELGRQEETEHEIRDQWDRWEWPYSQATFDGTLYVPRVDAAVKQWVKDSGFTKRLSQWPDNKPFAICLTHDVDFISRRATSMRFIAELTRRCWLIKRGRLKFFTSQLLKHIAKYLVGPILRFHHKDEYHCFDSCMKLEQQFGFKSTFFFFAEHLPAPHVLDCGYSHADRVEFFGTSTSVRGMIREMLIRGWDIGLHGSYTSVTDLSALMAEKQQLEQNAGVPISAIRHHYLHYDMRITPALHQQAGLRVDSTMGFNRNIGFRSGTAFPYYCWNHQDQRATNVLEVPLHLMDGPLLSSYGLECNIKMATIYMKMMMDRVAAVGGCLTLNWHPSWLSLKPFREIYELALREAYKRNAWGCSVSDLCRHWLSSVYQPGS